MPIYQDYAHVYDRSGQLRFSMRMLRYLDELLERFAVPGTRMIDLACGTGTVAIGMALHGFTVEGIDGSAEMLAEAALKTPAGTAICWSQQDMRTFSAQPAHLLTCLYDSLNYILTNDELLAVFRRVRAALEPHGLFIFDMNTPWVLANHWDDATLVLDTPDLTTILQSVYDPHQQRAGVTVTCFERQGELYRKIQENHQEQAYPLEQISDNLVRCGFQIEALYECFTFDPADDSTQRALWVARRRPVDGLHLL
ncbi:MAG: class I SAM-dependent methyltransferase [Chloroflexi bacterium]|nr:class I SAM-dependent methyltransferase [Chloroflexota bacterium]